MSKCNDHANERYHCSTIVGKIHISFTLFMALTDPSRIVRKTETSLQPAVLEKSISTDTAVLRVSAARFETKVLHQQHHRGRRGRTRFYQSTSHYPEPILSSETGCSLKRRNHPQPTRPGDVGEPPGRFLMLLHLITFHSN